MVSDQVFAAYESLLCTAMPTCPDLRRSKVWPAATVARRTTPIGASPAIGYKFIHIMVRQETTQAYWPVTNGHKRPLAFKDCLSTVYHVSQGAPTTVVVVRSANWRGFQTGAGGKLYIAVGHLGPQMLQSIVERNIDSWVVPFGVDRKPLFKKAIIAMLHSLSYL